MVKKIKIDNETDELNYLFGGYFSACGSVRIGRRLSRKIKGSYMKLCNYDLIVNVFFEDLKDAKLLQQNFGGGIDIPKDFKCTIYEGRICKYKKHIRWRMNCNEAGLFLGAIQPYLIGKLIKKKVKLAIKFHNYKQKHFKTKNEVYKKQKHQFYLQMRRLK